MSQGTETPDQQNQEPTEQQSFLERLRSTGVFIVIAIATMLSIQFFFFKPYKIPSGSMIPTLQVGDKIMVSKISMRFSNPERGDMIVFHPPPKAQSTGTDACGVSPDKPVAPGSRIIYRSMLSSDQAQAMPCPRPNPGAQRQVFVKRVIGLPGDRLKVIQGSAYVNGRKLNEPYLNSDSNCKVPAELAPALATPGCTLEQEIVIPEEHYFMMGDNRGNSDDSRYWGPLPRKNVIGTVIAVYWPVSSARWAR